jgi:hypothetical protein
MDVDTYHFPLQGLTILFFAESIGFQNAVFLKKA